MFCSECGNEISDSAKFCPSCGAKQNINRDSNSQSELENKEVDRFFNFSLDEFIRLEDYEIKQILLEAVESFRNNAPEEANYIKNNILRKFQGEIYPDSIEDLFYKLIDLENKSNDNNITNPKSKNTYNTNISSTILKSARHRIKKNDSTSSRFLRQIRDQFITILALEIFGIILFNSLIEEYLPSLNSVTDNGNFKLILFILSTVITWLGTIIYFAPWNIAWARRHPSSWGVLVVNILLGWTFIFWVVALLWSTSPTSVLVTVENKDS